MLLNSRSTNVASYESFGDNRLHAYQKQREPIEQPIYRLYNRPTIDATEDVNQNPEASASQVTVEKFLDLKAFKLAPGSYTLRIRVTDKKRNQSLPLTAQFTVT